MTARQKTKQGKLRKMTLFQFADVKDQQLVIVRQPNEKRFTCYLKPGFMKEREGDTGVWGLVGNGNSAQEARRDLVRSIRGKILVDGYPKYKKAFRIPKNLSV